jgi:hypothetical protein
LAQVRTSSAAVFERNSTNVIRDFRAANLANYVCPRGVEAKAAATVVRSEIGQLRSAADAANRLAQKALKL